MGYSVASSIGIAFYSKSIGGILKLLKVATVFSGIGSIEHALQRANIPHEIKFACDNGGVNIFTKNIPKLYGNVAIHTKKLQDILANDDDLTFLTALQISKLREQFQQILTIQEALENIYIQITNNIKNSPQLKSFIDDFNYHNREFKQIKNFPNKIINNLSIIKNYEVEPDLFSQLIVYVEDVTNGDLSNIKWELSSVFGDAEVITKEIKTNLIQVIDSIKMLFERIETAKITYQLQQFPTSLERKIFIDSLYKSKEKSNFVYKSYMENYDLDKAHFHWNISFLDGTTYRNQIDLLVGGSPCQSFSAIGKLRGLEDTRGTLFYEYARLIKEIQPKVFIYENVRGLLTHDKGETWKVIQNVFNELQYDWHFSSLNSKNYGIPQNRERIFVVGFKRNLKLNAPFEFPKAIPLQSKLKDFLLENVSEKYYLKDKGVDFVTNEKNLTKCFTQINGDIQLCQKANQQFNWHGDFVFTEENKNSHQTKQDLKKYFLSAKVEKYVLSGGTKTFYQRPEIDLEIARPLLHTMHKMHRAGIDNYVTTYGRIRKLTPRECLRLMGFCDTFKIVVSDTQMYQQAGNSIVVDVLLHLLQQIIFSYPSLTKQSKAKS